MTETQTMTDSTAPALDEGETDPYEELRRRIFDMRCRGLSYAAIGKMVGKNAATVRYHYLKAKQEHTDEIEEKGWKQLAGSHVRRLVRAQEVCLSHLAALEQGEIDQQTGQVKPGTAKKGSLQAAIWMQTYLRACKQESDFELDTGLLPKASEKLDITLKDARAMTLEELQNECANLESQLVRARIVPDKHVEREIKKITHTIDTVATVVQGEGRDGVPKIAAPDPTEVARAADRLQKKVD